MGECVEITTMPKHHIKFAIKSSALAFDVKCPEFAAVGLGYNVNSFNYVICIGDKNQSSWIADESKSTKRFPTPHILSPHEYRRFWIKWDKSYIVFGRNESEPIIIERRKQSLQLNYCLLFVHDNGKFPAYWKLEMPPIFHKPLLRPIEGGKLNWISSNNVPITDAVIGGFEKEILYIMRASHAGSITPGKFVPSKKLGYLGWSGLSHKKRDFEILCGFDCIWVPSSFGNIPKGAVVGGYSENSGKDRLYVARAEHDGHLIPGKVAVSYKGCYITYGDKELKKHVYEILVCPEDAERFEKMATEYGSLHEL